MSKTDQDRRDSDSIKLATAYLDATRALESMPPAVSDAIWARLERSVLVDAGSRSATDEDTDDAPARLIPPKRRWWVAASIAVSVAAALLLAVTLSPGERAGAQGGSQVSAAAYRAKMFVEQSAIVEGARSAPQSARGSTGASPSALPTEATPSTSEVSSPATSAGLPQTSMRGSDEDPPKARSRRRAATREEASAADLAAGDAPDPVVQKPARRESAAPEGSSLAAETRSIAEARNALDAGEPARALKLLDRHSAAYPEGFFGEEAAALRIIALCRSDELLAGRAAASEFFQAYPSSALRARVRDACPSTR